jgi:hypothetical protein
MRRSASEATVDDLRALLNITLAFRNGHRANANRLPIYADTILLAVAVRPEGRTMREIRADYALTHSSVTRTCLAMVRTGLVQIARDPTDRRRTLVKLTQRGQRVIDDVLAAYRGPRHRA